ncbi:DUF4440 domain-containing protein [Actinocorallia populi]|uniref:DUF4440 domain-containing protein n=1 Tax=Actinocorallia populi TaxID=2079200 RepID=UPI0013002FEC|nr:DUF4440 domain-containing protein [Actinocorallia populi]
MIERWLSGAADPVEFAAFADAHAPAFRMVGVDGVALERREVLSRVRSAHGHAPNLTIGIRDVRVIAEGPELLLVSYEEWHGAGQGRHATAVLVKGAALRWLHLHETRIPA